MNYEEIEKNLTRNGLIVEDKDPTDLFNSRLNELAKSLNISVGTPSRTVSAKNNTERRSVAFSSDLNRSSRHGDAGSGYNNGSSYNNGSRDNIGSSYNNGSRDNIVSSYNNGSKSYVGSSIGPRKPMSNSAILLNSGIKYGSASASHRNDRDDESEEDESEDDRDDNDHNGSAGQYRRDEDSRGDSRGDSRDHNDNSGSEYSDESEDDRDDHRGDSRGDNDNKYSHGTPNRNSTPRSNSAQRSKDFPNFDYSIKPDSSSEFGRRTQEERIHNQVREVINDMGGDNGIVSLENARKEDEKICMLEEIDSLKQGLEEEGAQGLDKIPRVSEDSSYEMVENVLKRLRLKNDRSRYTSLADEFILWGASALEDLFDGKRSWFGKKPDLTGWSKEVQVKLRRMHHDTSTLISGIMHDFNIGPATRVVLELVPNCVMYARRKKINHGKPDIFESEDISNSINNIRNFE